MYETIGKICTNVHLSNMKENDKVVVIRPNGNLELNREEFASWLAKEFGR